MNFSRVHSGTKVRHVNRACFPKEKTPEFTQKWAKFMDFSFWPFLWFGLPGRLLIKFFSSLSGARKGRRSPRRKGGGCCLFGHRGRGVFRGRQAGWGAQGLGGCLQGWGRG